MRRFRGVVAAALVTGANLVGRRSQAQPLPRRMLKAIGDGDVVAVAAWLDGGGSVEASYEARAPDGHVVTGLTMLMRAAAHGHGPRL